MCVTWSRPSSWGDRQQIWTNITYFRKVVCSFTIANVISNHLETQNSQSSYSPHSMTANTLDFGCVLALKNVNTLDRNPSTTPLLDLCESACWHVHCTQSYMCMFSSLRQSQVTYTSRHVASASSQLKDAPPPPPVGGPELTYLPHATHHMSQPSPPPLLRPSTPPSLLHPSSAPPPPPALSGAPAVEVSHVCAERDTAQLRTAKRHLWGLRVL